MKKKGTAFTIPEPCHEGWSNMKPVEKGRYCSSCEKVVIDFSGMSDFQIMSFMQEQKGSVCGRMSTQQLNRTMHLPQQPSSYPVFSLRALVLGTALSTFTAIDASAQKMGKVKPIEPTPVENRVMIKGEVMAAPEPSKGVRKYSGVVLSDSGDTLRGAVITLFTESYEIITSYETDEHGRYAFEISEGTDVSLITFMLTGYITETLTEEQLQASSSVILTEQPIMLEGLIMPVEE